MNDYERGRRDAIRDVILYLVNVRERYYASEPEYHFVDRNLGPIEKLTAVTPSGAGTDWNAIDTARAKEGKR